MTPNIPYETYFVASNVNMNPIYFLASNTRNVISEKNAQIQICTERSYSNDQIDLE